MTARRPLLFLILLVAPALAGCWHAGEGDDGEDPPPATGTAPTQPPQGKLTFGGRVVDARTGEPVEDATVRLDLAQTNPCRRQGVLWNAYALPLREGARYGPFEIAIPRSDDVAFFLHVDAPGYSENVTFVGPAEASAGVRNVTVVLHPDAALEGRAPPGTLVALDAPGFPRLALAGADGAFRIEGARVVEAAWVANTEPPLAGRVTPPATLDLAPRGGPAWRLEGVAKDASGAPVAVDVVAWNGSVPVSVARSNAAGLFALPLDARPQDVMLEARTPDGALGGSHRVVLDGPPALRQDVVLQRRC